MTQPAQVEVPDLVGLRVQDARNLGHQHGIVVTGRDLDGPPLGALTWPGTWIVTGQQPAAGQRIRRNSTVTITFTKHPDDGDAGDREPREPLPRPQTRQAAIDPDELDA